MFPSSPRGRYGETRSFQITGKYLENIKVNLDEVQGIFAEDNAELKSLLEKYSVDSVERCARWL